MALQFMLLGGRRHDRAAFRCGVPSLDTYLQNQAGQHQRNGIATTHVLIEDAAPGRILGYCSLSAAQMNLTDLQPADRKFLPSHPIPAVRIGHLAESKEEQGKGYGALLLGHAMNCSLKSRHQLGVKVILVDALDESAASFHRAHGFRMTAEKALTLYLSPGKS